MQEKYLPIGTICTLKGKNKKIMITGFCSMQYNGNIKIKDYLGCVYPEGLLLPEQSCAFNHSDIESIDFLGFINEDEKKFKSTLNYITGNENSAEGAKKFHEENEMFLTTNSTFSKLLFDENGVVMIAEPTKTVEEPKSKTDLENIKFDENGTVIGIGDNVVENPFKVEYKPKSNGLSNDFKNIKFDENGIVANTDLEEKNPLTEIKFDENGVVISMGVDIPVANSNYLFDENGVVISDVTKKAASGIKFDENGVVISDGTNNSVFGIPESDVEPN